MSRCRFPWVFLILSLALTPSFGASTGVRVDETKTQLQIGASESRLKFAVSGAPAGGRAVRVDVELLDPKDRIVKALSHESILTAGFNLLEIPLGRFFPELSKKEEANFLWYRLRYRLKPSSPASDFEVVEGVLSVSEISPQPFQLKVGLPQYGVEGTRCRVHVFTSHPASGRSVKGVTVTGTLTIQDATGERVLTSAGLTNSSGYAALDFELPRHVENSDATVSVKARLGGVVKELSEDLEFQDRTEVLLSTDKPLYQPGQALRVRVLAFDASRRALAQSSLTLRIKDPEGTQVYRSELTTSRFGEANVEWMISENARLGDYSVEVHRQNSSHIWAQSIKVSRYELPNFTLSVKPDRPYYLASQNAEVMVRADYLFGQPLKRGHVKVVRETERHWNYREQKYDTKEGQTLEGEIDAEGQFLAKIDLAGEHAKLADNEYQRYIDLRFAAYATDPTTNRTEQRRFDLRLTKDPIHVYVTKDRNVNSEGFPLEFYLSTFYADGTPAKCDVAVREVYERVHRLGSQAEPTSQLLRVVKTNRYGVAKISGLRTTPSWQTDRDNPLLLFIADDRKGGQGKQAESFWGEDRPAIRIHTNKTLYRAAEPLEVEIESSLKNGKVVLDISREDRILHSRVVRLRKGKAFVVIPSAPEFKDDLTLVAYSVDNPNDDYYPPHGVRRVLYPRNRELKVDLRVGQTTYEPGQEASTTFRVRTAEGLAKESLLGVVVLDKAVEERARTDIEFGSPYGFYSTCARLLGFDRELSGLTRRDLDRLDLSQPVPDDLELAADVLLNSWTDYYPHRLSQEDPTKHPREVFQSLIATQLAPLKKTLENRYAQDGGYPSDETSLRNMISGSGLNLDEDPWSARYRMVFSTDQSLDIVEMISAGPDKQFDSSDDIRALRLSWPYFRPHGENINRLVKSYHQRTGGFVRDLPTLKAELLNMGDGFDSWRDRWGQPYQVDFAILTTHFTLTIRSSGPNRLFEGLDVKKSDDFPVWTTNIDYTVETRTRLDQALNRYFHEGRGFPETPPQFEEAWRLSNIEAQNLLDPWGRSYYPIFKNEFRNADRPTIISYAEHLRTSQQHTSLVPVTRQIQFLVLRSAGPDSAEGTSDDFDVATFSRVLTEQSSGDATAQPVTATPGLTGAITGIVTDATGAVIPVVNVKATHSSSSRVFETKSDDSGRYLLRNLLPGLYDVQFKMAGFRLRVIRDVPVQSSAVTQLSATLELGTVSQTVEVSAGPAILMQTESAEVAQVRESFSMKLPAQSSTPRLREYFPETLVWQPSLETDRAGRAQLKFKLADNITTWKMAVVASTVDGLIGMAEKEILSFQPFFLEHDPPQVLTEGDEIALPVVLRNYLNKDQSVDLSIKPESWFTSLDPMSKKSSIKAGDAAREIFGFKAVASVKEGKQRITALGSAASDAIEKPVTVHPDGEEVVQSVTQVFKELSRLDLTLSAEAIPNTARAELKIYPNLMAHVVEGIEGVLQRPYGCGEQTISSTYPSLLLLRFYKQSGAESPQLAQKARRYLQTGYERLLGYRTEDGGFSYWGGGAADVALTAYALRFLRDADGFLAVDEAVLKGAYQWLVRQQQADGSWASTGWQSQNVRQRSLNLTTLVARVLSIPGLRDVAVASSSRLKQPQQRDPVRLALQFLQARTEESDEPYGVASLALAALNLGEKATAESALKRLEAMVKREGDTAYWHLQANTPFYSWGLPGRLETTALAVRALALGHEGHVNSTGSNTSTGEQVSSSRESLIRQALLFLLRNKDRYGVWYSSQATVNVLDAFISLLGNDGGKSTSGGPAEILVNGKPAGSLSVSIGAEAVNPITVDLSKFLATGSNQIEVRRSAGSSEATVQLLETHYVPWAYSSAAKPKVDAESASAIRLAVRFDKTEAKVSEDITCHVEVERIGFRGYGMLLGEIGLPPGADVDRASLDEAVKTAGWDLYRYDVLPDRLIVYLWPRAGGTKFQFKFRQRYGLKAQTAASVVYDYYNPESRGVVKPAKFTVR